MWMLFVMSMNYDGDMKVTQYDQYKDQVQCERVLYKVTSKFTEGEKAFCHYVDYLKPKDKIVGLPKN